MKKYECSLTKEEYNFFLKNPHCIASVCDLSRISPVQPKNNYKHIYENNKKEIEDTGFKKLDFNDVTKDKQFYELVDDLIEDATRDMGGIDNVRYREGGQRPKSAAHIGQLKLFLSTMQFLTKYTRRNEINHIIYPGSAPGNNIQLLTKLFPNCYWYLYDPRNIFHKELYKNKKIKKIIVNYFTDDHISELLETITKDQKILLISDIRVCSDVTEDSIDRDMRLQEDWVLKLKPDYSLLKFRLPRTFGKWYKYFNGDLYLQPFAPVASTECRLVVHGKDLREVEYNVDLYEGLLYYFNKRARLLSYHHDKLIDFFDTCHDCVLSYSIIEDYKELHDKKINPRYLMQSIVNKIDKHKLINHNITLESSLKMQKNNSTRGMYTITFGEVAESHVGMQKIGELGDEGFDLNDLKIFSKYFEDIGCKTEIINLHEGQEFNPPEAYILIIRDAIDFLFEKNASDEMLKEQDSIEYDTKAKMRGRVVNKRARYNIVFGEKYQKSNIEEGKGTIYPFDKLPYLKKIRGVLGNVNIKASELNAEGNYYYDIDKCGIGYHGDAERKKVIALRLYEDKKDSVPIHYVWYKKHEPVSDRISIAINHGDLYIMSEKATGFDWKKSSIFTLRHATGCDKYVKL